MNEPNTVAVARQYVAAYDRRGYGERSIWPTMDRLYAICTALIAESERAKRLHEALRLQVICHNYDDVGSCLCDLCDASWPPGKELHAPDCLAAPLSEEGM